MSDDNSPLSADDRISIIRRLPGGSGEYGSVTADVIRPRVMNTRPTIANIANDANGTAIATAVNAVLAALRANNVIDPPA